MKKLALLALVVCLGVAGCENKPAGGTTGTSGTSGTSAPASGTGSSS